MQNWTQIQLKNQGFMEFYCCYTGRSRIVKPTMN